MVTLFAKRHIGVKVETIQEEEGVLQKIQCQRLARVSTSTRTPQQRTKPKKKYNEGGFKPIALYMVGEYEGEKAVIVGKEEKITYRKQYVGIGDDLCQFKNFGDNNVLERLGPKSKDIHKTEWFARTMANKRFKIRINRFQRSNEFIEEKDIDNYFASGCSKKVKKDEEKASVQKAKPQPQKPPRQSTEADLDYNALVKSIIQTLCPKLNKAKLEHLAKNIEYETKGVNPHRSVYVKKHVEAEMNLLCSNFACARRIQSFVDCGHEYACRHCGTTMPKVHKGLDYREMKDRDADMNGICTLGQNSLFSSAFNNATMVRIAKGKPKYDNYGEPKSDNNGEPESDNKGELAHLNG